MLWLIFLSFVTMSVYSFNFNNLVKPNHVPLNFEISPSKLVGKFSNEPIGKPWSYSEFMDNLQKQKIDGVSFLGNYKDNLVALDNNINNYISHRYLSNIFKKHRTLHFFKLLS